MSRKKEGKQTQKHESRELRLQRIEHYIESLYKLYQGMGTTIGAIMENWYRGKFGNDWEEKLFKLLKSSEDKNEINL